MIKIIFVRLNIIYIDNIRNNKNMKTASILKELNFNETKPAISVMMETDFTKEIRILFRKDQLMKEHKAPLPIVVEIVDGEIDFGVNGESFHLKKGELISLEANMPHNLTALSESIVRLTLSKGDHASRVKEVTTS
ncbi:quercetin dioxygenase-like cupin family protein [Pedobacter sp. UYP30]|uniref:cupin domain-containing protein n=1 Tax=Pedobacter sp. UYP30 TaxID=1756400 RepID=UPI0033982B57